MRDHRTTGATLLEILMAMIVIGLVAGGILTAFIFGRRVTWRSGTELSGAGLVQETADNLRATIGGGGPAGLSLEPGVYVDNNMQNPPTGFSRIAALNFPGDFLRFQTDPGTGTSIPPVDPDGDGVFEIVHGDGRLVVVESPVDSNSNGILDPAEIAAADLDGDGQTGLDLSNPPDGVVDLRRVRIRVKWTSPTS